MSISTQESHETVQHPNAMPVKRAHMNPVGLLTVMLNMKVQFSIL